MDQSQGENESLFFEVFYFFKLRLDRGSNMN